MLLQWWFHIEWKCPDYGMSSFEGVFELRGTFETSVSALNSRPSFQRYPQWYVRSQCERTTGKKEDYCNISTNLQCVPGKLCPHHRCHCSLPFQWCRHSWCHGSRVHLHSNGQEWGHCHSERSRNWPVNPTQVKKNYFTGSIANVCISKIIILHCHYVFYVLVAALQQWQ